MLHLTSIGNDHGGDPITSKASTRSDERTIRISYDLRKQIQLLTQATVGAPELAETSTVRHVLGNLDWAMLGLCQIIEQLRHYLLTELQAGRLTSQDGTDPTTDVDAAVDAIGQAHAGVAGMSQALARAEVAIRSINSRPSPAQVAAASFPTPITGALGENSPAGTPDNDPPEQAQPPTDGRRAKP